MKVTVLSEHGFEEALLGLSLSRNQSIERMKEIAVKKAFGESGEAKFLEFIGNSPENHPAEAGG